MNDSITEAKELTRTAEKKIARIIADLQRNTGLIVGDVEVKTMQIRIIPASVQCIPVVKINLNIND